MPPFHGQQWASTQTCGFGALLFGRVFFRFDGFHCRLEIREFFLGELSHVVHPSPLRRRPTSTFVRHRLTAKGFHVRHVDRSGRIVSKCSLKVSAWGASAGSDRVGNCGHQLERR